MPKDRPKTGSNGFGASRGRPQQATTFPKPKCNRCCLTSRLVASGKPQDGSKMAQGPGGLQDSSKSALKA
eukprot:2199728-Pyramimonas_sp.AAC.1